MRGKKNPYKKPDAFTKKAKDAGYPARSVYKLEEIDRRVQLFRPGMHVLDLGAAPGSWTLYAAQRIGANGRLLAIDVTPITIAIPPNCTFCVGDAFSIDNHQLSTYAPYDVVINDMAPSTTGNRLQDQTRSYDLFMRALEVAKALLKPRGSFVGKIFMGEDFPFARKALKDAFNVDRVIRPEGTRSMSYEIFLIGIDRKGDETPSQST